MRRGPIDARPGAGGVNCDVNEAIWCGASMS